MTSIKFVVAFATSLVFSSTLTTAQSALDSPFYNRAVLRYYPSAALKNLEQNDPSKIDLIQYYFNQSYDVRIVGCPECDVDYNVFLNEELFNIVDFESQRLPSTEVIIPFKKNVYEITLHPILTVESNLESFSIDDILTLEADSPLPQWVSTGDNVADYEVYKRALAKWIVSYPEDYRTLTNDSNLIKISISEFLTLPQDKLTSLSSNPEGYIIID